MQLTRRALAADRRHFGRGPRWDVGRPSGDESDSSLGADVSLFLTTFLAGFIFVSVLIA